MSNSKKKRIKVMSFILSMAMTQVPLAEAALPSVTIVAEASEEYVNWNGQHTYGELKRFIDNGGKAYFDEEHSSLINNIKVEKDSWSGKYKITYTLDDEHGWIDTPSTALDFNVYVPKDSVIPPLAFKVTDVTYNSYLELTLGNDNWDIGTLCSGSSMKISKDTDNYKVLEYDNRYNYTSGLDTGKYIKDTENHLYCYFSALYDGENIITFTNPDKSETTIRVNKTGSYGSYNVTLITDTPKTYTVTWKNGDETLETDTGAEANSKPSYDGSTPTKADDADNTYAFAGWSTEKNGNAVSADALPAVTADVTYYAVFTSSPKTAKYTVTWKNGSTELEKDENVTAGTAPSYDGAAPAKAETDDFTYTFAGWSASENGTVIDTLPNVTADVTYYAVFTPVSRKIFLSVLSAALNRG